MEHITNPWFKNQNKVIDNKIRNAFALEGKGLPCHVMAVNGALITVAFDVLSTYTLPTVTIPLFGPEYIRYPIKKGDLGVCVPLDSAIDYTTGMASTPGNLDDMSNLSALFFMPVGNKNWVAVDPAQVDIYAPNGVKIHDTGSGAIINLHPNQISISVGSTTFVLTANSITATTQTFTVNAPAIVLNGQLTQGTNAGGYPATLQGPITVVHDVTAGGKSLVTHEHSGVQSGSGTSGPPV